jgi:hypothetical protein
MYKINVNMVSLVLSYICVSSIIRNKVMYPESPRPGG